MEKYAYLYFQTAGMEILADAFTDCSLRITKPKLLKMTMNRTNGQLSVR